MARRPQCEINFFGILIQYWGPPTLKFRVGISHERQLRKFARWSLLLALVPLMHNISAEVLVSRSLTLQTAPLDAAVAIVRWILGIYLAISAIQDIEK